MRGEALVMAGPGDEMAAAAGGRSRLRTSDADREQVVELLKAAFVQGRLAKDEFSGQVGQVLASRTYAELDAVTAGIPAGVAGIQPPRTRLGAYVASRQRRNAIGQYERVLADRERIRGPDHPETIAARANLAFAYRSAGRLREAVPAYERTVADRERVQGRDHPDTLTARANLAACYQLARRLPEAIPAYKRALADCERVRGPGDVETLTTRCNLASAYYMTGRLTDVVVILRRALTDCECYLGPDH